MVIACDGIWDCVENAAIVKYFEDKQVWKEEKKITEVVSVLLDELISPQPWKTKSEGSTDNMTCMVICFKENNKSLVDAPVAAQ